MTKFIKLFLAVILLASCSKKSEESNLTVLTDNGEVTYMVENAQTVAELEKGLMFRESLAPKAGMIFDLSKVEKVAMWMKNTKIPLDMIFIDKDGTISWIFENAEPESKTLIMPPFPAVAVLEVNAGDVQKNKIKTGDVVRHKFFSNDTDDQPVSEARAVDEAEIKAMAADEVPVTSEKPDTANDAVKPTGDAPEAMTE